MCELVETVGAVLVAAIAGVVATTEVAVLITTNYQ